MSKFDKLKERILKEPKDFTYDELKTLLTAMGYTESNKGKTSGSKVAFTNQDTQHIVRIHKPHPKNIIKQYALRFIIDELKSQNKL